MNRDPRSWHTPPRRIGPIESLSAEVALLRLRVGRSLELAAIVLLLMLTGF